MRRVEIGYLQGINLLVRTVHHVFASSQFRIMSLLASSPTSEFLELTLTIFVPCMHLYINGESLNYIKLSTSVQSR